MGKASGTFQTGRGSTKSFAAGVVTGRNQGLYRYGLSRSTYIGNAVVRKQAASGAGWTSGQRPLENTKSFVAGKIAGQYQAKGYSKAHAQSIGNKVVGKASGTFQTGRGSTKSFAAGVVTGRNQGIYGYSLSRSTNSGNAGARKQVDLRKQAAGPKTRAQRSKILRFAGRNSGALPVTAPVRHLRDRSKIRGYEQIDFDEPDLSKVSARQPNKAPGRAQSVRKTLGYTDAESPTPCGSAALGSKILRFVDRPSQDSCDGGRVSMSKIAGWADPADEGARPGASAEASGAPGEHPVAVPGQPGDGVFADAQAAPETTPEAAVAKIVDASSDERAKLETSSNVSEESVVSIEDLGPMNAEELGADFGRLNQRILAEIEILAPLAMKVDPGYDHSAYMFDISETEFEGIKFLIDYAQARETLDYFEIVTQLLALKHRAPEKLGVTRSDYIDALIQFIRACVEAR
ncbi:hypothetical protein [Tessaracoccus lacteus]|uniref:Peptidase S74 domain-containing protein n=1 Tax=Tessaracoccus lacteus TaxID=3041766 RepID=A0ABY8PWJ6_9ACTN|nr:hypothetical protein [Tessaracoccus sp. T21]WGT46681.1 hypothetical protein QH948_11110 [Tessaracoccus sp. T21]